MTTINPENGNVIALVTGANRGLGRRFALDLLARGAKVYAAARRPETIDIPGAVAIQLDITDPESVRRAAETASDVNVLVNNAGVSTRAQLLSGDIADIRLEMETHYFGTLDVTRAFAPVIEANGGGAILNVLSVLSWAHLPTSGAYSAAKAAAWAMTDAVRQELAPRGIHVAALHVGYMDTDMAAFATDAPKSDPGIVARLTLDGLFAGEPEILADELSRTVKAGLSQPPLVADHSS
ncbi:SDR family oxidoreductase [Mycolicibacterium sp. 120270]|uniref:SDR family oxidoreductase n=1 Tax=Mycolicibacterium sp. 120270 TaxID=3090600 RepID=UPI00299D756D|nr:SDR family oxidoreductase [Mycolicibacterium sp. 120270]MDX1883806.1 SDR family oxidoreductase [Mycolicibacterium sp. 120270]